MGKSAPKSSSKPGAKQVEKPATKPKDYKGSKDDKGSKDTKTSEAFSSKPKPCRKKETDAQSQRVLICQRVPYPRSLQEAYEEWDDYKSWNGSVGVGFQTFHEFILGYPGHVRDYLWRERADILRTT